LQALLLVGKKAVEQSVLHDIVTHRAFLDDVPHKIGTQMRATILANLHVFNSKYQKLLVSAAESSRSFGAFLEKKAKSESKEKRRGSDENDDERKRPRTQSNSDCERDSRRSHKDTRSHDRVISGRGSRE